MQVGLDIVRARLPDGRALLVERCGSTWDARLEADGGPREAGAPLVVVRARLLGHELVPDTWPWWLYALAEHVEASSRRRAPP